MSIKTTIVRSLAAACVAAMAVSALAVTPQEQEILDRIKPVGEVCVQGDAACAAPVAVASGPRSGEDVYKAACFACHGTGVGGAPKMGAADEWAPRLAQGEATYLANAINGIRAMPPKGTCATCSDEEILAAINYMAGVQ